MVIFGIFIPFEHNKAIHKLDQTEARWEEQDQCWKGPIGKDVEVETGVEWSLVSSRCKQEEGRER